jgi:hypothetical protein
MNQEPYDQVRGIGGHKSIDRVSVHNLRGNYS